MTHVPRAALTERTVHREDMRDALAQRDFGRVFFLARKWDGISYSAIAESCDIKPERVGQLARGQGWVTSHDKLLQIADGLRIPGHLIGLLPRPWEEEAAHRRQGESSTAKHQGFRLLDDLEGSSDWLTSSPRHGRRIGATTVDSVAARIHALRIADDVLAGGDLVIPAQRELDTALALYREHVHTDDVGRALLRCVGELGQITGWILSDAGRHVQADHVYRLGLSAAREAGQSELAGNLAGSLAYQQSNTGQQHAGLELARAALDEAGTGAHPQVRALFYDRIAWAHAHVGDAQAAMRALGHAHECLTIQASEDGPTWAYWVSREELEVMDARVYTELHRPLRAVPLLSSVLDRYDTTHTREYTLYMSWLAVALMDANEPEQAAHTAGRMLEMSTEVASDRTTQRSAVVLQKLEKFRDIPEVRTVLDAYEPRYGGNRDLGSIPTTTTTNDGN